MGQRKWPPAFVFSVQNFGIVSINYVLGSNEVLHSRVEDLSQIEAESFKALKLKRRNCTTNQN